MKLKELLKQYPEEALDQIARDKVDAIANVRLPRSVLEREITATLSSFSYVAETMAASHPPTYVFLKLLMETPEHSAAAYGFKEAVLERTDRFTEQASRQPAERTANRARYLYLSALKAAWEFGNRITASEANLLETLRTELGIPMREHLLLEHHPDVRPVWDSPRAYETARNYLLAKGLVLTHGNHFVLPDEVAVQIRKYWGVELQDAAYGRLLSQLTIGNLRSILDAHELALSGSKDQRIERIIGGMVAPSDALDVLTINELKDLSRTLRLPVSLSKPELIAQLIGSFDQAQAEGGPGPAGSGTGAEADPGRQLETEAFQELLSRFTGSQLQEILDGLGLPRSGRKNQRVKRILKSPFSEIQVLSQLRRRELSNISQRLGLTISGLKEDLIERIIASAIQEPDDQDQEELAVAEHLTPAESLTAADIVTEAASENVAKHPEVPGLQAIRQRFPTLAQDQQLVLALLHEARSLTERDIQRLTLRHGLNWLLPKAHMAELLRTLTDSGNKPVRIRSIGSTNIYEWYEAAKTSEQEPDSLAARDVIEALRQGVVPEQSSELLFVGQEAARAHLLEQLDYVAAGRSSFKFIRGAYGAGKSFLLWWFREQALEAGFAIANVRVGAELSLGDLAEFYSGVMDGLRIPEKRGASSLIDIVEAWLLAVQRRVEQIEGLDSAVHADRKKIDALMHDRISTELSDLAAHDGGLTAALRSFYAARVAGDDERAAAAIAWMRGDRSLAAATLRDIGVRGILEADQAMPRLKAILEILAATHLKGLVILMDELELVRRRPHRLTRDQAYETLRALLDEAGENRLKGTLLISTGTDTFFEDRRHGIASYEALLHRIQVPEYGEAHRSVRQPIIQLEGLDANRLASVAKRTRAVHAMAYGWPAEERVTDADIEVIVSKWSEFGGEQIERLPRPFLRQFVHVLDLCEENPDLSALDFMGDPADDTDVSEALLHALPSP